MYRQSPTELKSTISTMKIIALFALFGLSFVNGDGGGTGCPVNPNAKDPNCLTQAMKVLGYYLSAAAKYFCAYKRLEVDGNTKNYNTAAKEYIDLLKCTGCNVDDYFGDGNTIENLLVPVGDTTAKAFKMYLDLLEIMGLSELQANLICTLAGGLLQSQCLQNALLNIAPGILLDLTKLYCKGSGATGAAAGLTALLGQFKCALDEQLGLKDGELEKALESLSNEYLQGLLGNLLHLTGEKALGSLRKKYLPGLVGNLLQLTGNVNLTKQLLCTVINPPTGGGILKLL